MTKIKKKDQGENLLNIAEGLRKSDVVTEIVENLAEGFAEQIELITKIIMIDFDVDGFFEDKKYQEKVLNQCYGPDLSWCEFEGLQLVSTSIDYYKGTVLPVLPFSLQDLCMIHPENLTSLSGIERLNNLNALVMFNCSNLIALSGIEGCENLNTLELHICHKLKSLSGVEGLKNLQNLTFLDCPSLKILESLEGCENLQSLKIESCDNFKNFRGINRFHNLESLKVKYCNDLTSLSGIEWCENLKYFQIDSHNLENLDSESKEILKGLEENPDVEVVYS